MAAYLGLTNSKKITKLDKLQLNSSMLGVPLTLFWGQRRLSTNCFYYTDFKAHPQSAKGKGGGAKSGQFTYTAALAMGLGEGPVDDIVNVFENGSTSTANSLAHFGFTLFNGTAGQAPWSYVTTNHPTEALAYAYTAYVAHPNLSLGTSAQVPNHAYETVRLNGFTDVLTAAGYVNPATGGVTNGTDVSLADVIPDLLTSAQYGYNFASGDICDLTQFRAYQAGQGLYFSPYITGQEKVVDVLSRWAMLSNSWIYWAGTQLQVVPLGDAAVGGYVPDLAPAYGLTAKDFLGDVPVKVTRADPADCYNTVKMEICDRTRAYTANPIEYTDQDLYDRFGPRDSSTTQADEVCNPAVGAIVAQLIGKRAAYSRKTYSFKTSYRMIRLLPGSIVSLTEPNAGLNAELVRIRSVDEADDDTLSFTAEELVVGMATYVPVTLPPNSTTNFPSTNKDPGSINTPCIVEPNSTLTGGVAKLLVSASWGPDAGLGQVYLSFDGSNYNHIGDITANAAQGVLTAPLASYGGANPDNAHTLSVNGAESQFVPQPVTTADADAYRTLSVIAAQPTLVSGVMVMPTTQELLSFGNVAATGTYTADLTHLNRALYGTTAGAHSTGDQFTILDVSGTKGTTVVYTLPTQYIGQPVWVKVTLENIFGNETQSLASCQAYKYTPTGAGYGTGAGGLPSAPTGVSATPSSGQNLIAWTANVVADNVTTYKVYRGLGTSTAFGSCSLVWSGLGTSWMDTTAVSAQAYTYYVVATNAVGDSLPSTAANATSTTVQKDWQPQGYWKTPAASPDNEVFALPTKTGHKLAAGLPGSVIEFEVAPTANWTATLYADSTVIGTATVLAGHTSGTFSFASDYNFTGELFKMVAPAAADATASGLSFLYVGTRTQ